MLRCLLQWYLRSMPAGGPRAHRGGVARRIPQWTIFGRDGRGRGARGCTRGAVAAGSSGSLALDLRRLELAGPRIADRTGLRVC